MVKCLSKISFHDLPYTQRNIKDVRRATRRTQARRNYLRCPQSAPMPAKYLIYGDCGLWRRRFASVVCGGLTIYIYIYIYMYIYIYVYVYILEECSPLEGYCRFGVYFDTLGHHFGHLWSALDHHFGVLGFTLGDFGRVMVPMCRARMHQRTNE